jgi:hypothetical protein
MMAKLGQLYSFIAVNLLSALVLFVLINIASSIYLSRSKASHSLPITKKYDQVVIDAYPHQTPEETKELLTETWSRPFQYAPYTMFREAASEGTFVNVHARGFRSNQSGGLFHDWPPNKSNQALTIFVFGGSTVFGYGLPDNETIPARLEHHLRARGLKEAQVYNFGMGSFTAIQECILFQSLLSENAAPDMAIFVNGLNDFYYLDGAPEFNEIFQKAFDERNDKKPLYSLIRELPLAKALSLPFSEGQTALEHSNDATASENAANRYINSLRCISGMSREFGVETMFVLQPVPTFMANDVVHPFAEFGLGGHVNSAEGYRLLQGMIEGAPELPNFLNLSRMQTGSRKALYVDLVHYNREMADAIAEKISRAVLAKAVNPAKE